MEWNVQNNECYGLLFTIGLVILRNSLSTSNGHTKWIKWCDSGTDLNPTTTVRYWTNMKEIEKWNGTFQIYNVKFVIIPALLTDLPLIRVHICM